MTAIRIVDDHLELANIGSRTHAQIDTAIDSLTDNSIADTLHRHSELVASDGSPDPALSVDASGNVGIGTTPSYNLDVSGRSGEHGTFNVEAGDDSHSAYFYVKTKNSAGSGTGHGNIFFYDGTTPSFKFTAALGFASGSRYVGFLAYSDRDGNELPVRFYTKDSGGTSRVGIAIRAGQAAGASGHVGIGIANPATSAQLDITSTDGALLLPRMTTVQKNALTALNGMVVYDSTLNKFQGYENGAWTSLI